jgi:flagellum-specific peptidoglycan hydrolase FlgJ
MGKDGKADVQRYHNLMGKAIDVFTQVQAGPNGELLLTTLGAKGGTAAQLALTQKMMSQLKTFNESVNSFNGAIGEEKGVDILKTTKADDPNLTPAQRDAAFVQADLMVQSLPEDQRQGAWEKVNKARSQANTSWTKPMQDRIERETSFSYDKDPATEIRRFEQLKVNGLMDPRAADRVIGQYRQLLSADMQPYRAAGAKAIKDLMEQEIAAMKLTGSDGDKVITQKEQTYLLNRQAQLSTGLETIRRQSMADGSGSVGFSEKIQVWAKGLKSQAPKPANPSMQPLMPKGPEAWKQSLGFFGQMGPGNSATNYSYKQRVDNGLVMDPKEFIKNYDDYVENGRLSDGLKLFIKRSGYGSNPSQFFFKQWNKAYPGVKMNQDDVEALKALDQQKISFAQPPAAANPYAQTAMNIQSMIRNASMGAMNVLVPPAAAADMSSMRGRPATGSQRTGWNTIVAAARAKGAKFPELVAAQWALESDWGRSVSGRNNFFGQKGPGTSRATWEVVNGRRVNTTASFRDFATPGDSVNFLISKWYKGKSGANNARSVAEAAQILKRQGYATDPEYVNKLLSIVNSNKGS